MRRPTATFEILERRQLLAGSVRPADVVSIGRAAPDVTVNARRAGGDVVSSVLTRTLQFGSPGAVGGYSFNQTSHSIDGAGTGIGGVADQFIFASAAMTQDFVVSARLTQAGSGDTGIMIRNTGGSTNAPMAALVVNGSTLKFVTRISSGAAATSTDVPAASTPIYLRLSRSGFVVSAAYSSDGLSWTNIGAPTRISFDSGASHAGIALASGSANQPTAATFTNVAVIGQSSNWKYTDVGTPAGAGSVGFDSPTGTHKLIAGGSGIGGISDSFNFAAQPLTGDGTVVARTATNGATAEAGVMIRAADSADAPFAALLTSAAGVVRYVYRMTAGGATQQTTVNTGTPATALKLYRQGNSVAAYYSVTGGQIYSPIGSSVTLNASGTMQAGLAATANAADASLVTATFTGVSVGSLASPGAGILTPADEAFLDDLEFRTVQWFVNTQQATSGLFPDRASAQPGGSVGGNFASMASAGFGLSALTIASSRGWIADGYERALKTLNFIWTDNDMANPANHGYFYHFVNQTTGARSGTSELSSIDTALLISGVIQAGQYWKGTAVETLAQQIYERVDWTFMQPNGAGTKLRHGWTPEGGFLSSTWDSWNEGPILYMVALGSPTHPISVGSWASFPRDLFETTYSGRTFYHASNSPLFTQQYPQGWFDLRGKSDRVDAESGAAVVYMDPYKNSINHTLAQRQALIDAAAGSNPVFDFYGQNAWGLTASDSRTGYTVFGGPPFTSNVNGTIVPTAPGGSLAHTPRESIDCLLYLKTIYPSSYRAWGFVDAFNPRPGIENWYDSDALGIDQGMMLIAAENLRSGLVWNGFMSNPASQNAVNLTYTNNANYMPTALASSQFNFETGQSLSFAFSQDVANSFQSADVVIKNLTTGQIVPAANWLLSVSTAGKPTTATVTFSSILADGNYELRIPGGSVIGADNVSNVADLLSTFRVLAGDADRDGTVGFSDLVILAQNYNTSGRTFSQGNFDYSAGGAVDFQDLVILSQRYGTSLFSASAIVAGNMAAGETSKPLKGRTRPVAQVF
jgi:hypothetical protein